MFFSFRFSSRNAGTYSFDLSSAQIPPAARVNPILWSGDSSCESRPINPTPPPSIAEPMSHFNWNPSFSLSRTTSSDISLYSEIACLTLFSNESLDVTSCAILKTYSNSCSRAAACFPQAALRSLRTSVMESMSSLRSSRNSS